MREFIELDPSARPDGIDTEEMGSEPIVDVEESEGQIRLSLKLPAFSLIDDPQEIKGEKHKFMQVDIDGVGYLVEDGKPLLPSFARYVNIPVNCDYEIQVQQSEPQVFEGIHVSPAQDSITDDPTVEKEPEYEEGFYGSAELYPDELVQVSGPYEMDAYRAILVNVRPIQYQPMNRKLLVHSDIEVTIRLTESAEEDEIDAYDRDLELESFGNLFLNPARHVEDRLRWPWRRIPRPIRPATGPQYLIISHEDFLPAAKRLADWKTKKGMHTKVVPISEVGNSVDSIKQYVRLARSVFRSRLRYLLLLGDTGHIETEITTGSPWGANATDYYYMTKRDSTSNTDLVMPSLAAGRIPAQSLQEAYSAVDQIIAYEKNPPADPEYYRRMTFAAYFQDNDQDGKAERRYMKTLETIRSHLISIGFDVERVYVSNNPNPQYYRDGTPVPPEVRAALLDSATATANLVAATSEGQLITAHRDHGVANGWHEPHFQIGDLNGVTGSMPSIFYSVNCLTGKFDQSATMDSFAEAILQMPGAAPSLIAATRVSHSFLNDDMMKALFDGMWPGILPSFPGTTASYGVRNNRLGDLLNYAKSYLPIVGSGSAAYIKDHFEIYHVIGDPALELWKDVPRLIRLRAFVRNFHLYLLFPIIPKGCIVTIWHKKKLLKRLQPSSTLIKLPLREMRIRPLPWMDRVLSVCAYAPGNRFTQVKARI